METKFNLKVFMSTIFAIALPIALQNLLTTTVSMVDTVMIGSLGETSVAAVGICAQISSFFFSCYYGSAGGSVLFFSQYWGAKDKKGINKTFGIAFTCMMIVGLIYGLTAIINPGFMLGIITDKEALVELGIPYLRIVGYSYPLTVIVMIFSFLLRSTERVKLPLYSSIASLIVNVVFNYVLIYGKFGFPKLGISGAAVGTLASTIVNLILIVVFTIKDKETVALKISEMFLWKGFVLEFFKKCAPIIANELLYGVGQMLINIVMGRQNESAIAANAAFRVLEGFVFAFFGGLASAAAVLIGKEIGAGRLKNAYKNIRGFAVLCPSITFIIVGIMFILNKPLLGLFGLGDTAIMYGKYMLLIYLFFGTIRTCNYIQNECYRSGGDPLFGTVLEITCLFTISVPATWLAGMVFKLPFLWVFGFVFTDEFIRLFFELRRTMSGKWIKPVTESGKAALDEFRASLKKK